MVLALSTLLCIEFFVLYPVITSHTKRRGHRPSGATVLLTNQSSIRILSGSVVFLSRFYQIFSYSALIGTGYLSTVYIVLRFSIRTSNRVIYSASIGPFSSLYVKCEP